MPASSLPAWILAGLLAVLGLLMGPFERRFYRSDPDPRRKLRAYAALIALQWILTSVAVWIFGWPPLLQSPVVAATWLPAPKITAPILLAATAGFVLLAVQPLVQSLRGPRHRAAIAGGIRRAFAGIPGLLPNTGAERAAFVLVSLTAGVCEEILYRGFLIRFLHESPMALSVAGALVVATLAFGLGHLYQGPRGIVSSSLAGLFIGLLFLLTGSLIPGMILHALMDAQVAYVLRPAARPAEARSAA